MQAFDPTLSVPEDMASAPVDELASVAPDGEGMHLAEAVRTAGSRAPEVLDAAHALVPLLSDPEQEIARRFEQVTGAVTAKGVEDTAYCRYNRLVSAN